MMIEPTESEDKSELDRFCDAMISIRFEIEGSDSDQKDNILHNAPHTMALLTADGGNPTVGVRPHIRLICETK